MPKIRYRVRLVLQIMSLGCQGCQRQTNQCFLMLSASNKWIMDAYRTASIRQILLDQKKLLHELLHDNNGYC